MICRLAISLVCVAMTYSASAEGQVRVQPGTEPQPLPGGAVPEFQPPRRFPRAIPIRPPQTSRPTSPAPNGPPQAPPAGPRQPTTSAFVELSGLSQPIKSLLDDLGYQDGKTVPLTPHTTFDLAFKCYADGRYADASQVYSQMLVRISANTTLQYPGQTDYLSLANAGLSWCAARQAEQNAVDFSGSTEGASMP